MMTIKSIVTLACVLIATRGNPFSDPCPYNDLECLESAIGSFARSRELLNLEQQIVPQLDVVADDDMGIVLHFSNITYTKNDFVDSSLQRNTEDKTISLKIQRDHLFFADIIIELTKSKKSFEGLYTASATVLHRTTYHYGIIKTKGKEFLDMSPGTTQCDVVGIPRVYIGKALQYEMESDPDFASLKSEWETKQWDIRNKTICILTQATHVAL